MSDKPKFRMPERAVRVFPGEMAKTTHTFKEEEDKMAPRYVLLPSGRRASRVILGGVITELFKSTETSERGSYEKWSARLVGPTGGIQLSASTMFEGQGAAVAMLERLPNAPFDAIVIGKPKIFGEGDDTVTIISIESIVPVGPADVVDVVVEAAIELANVIRPGQEPTPDMIKARAIYKDNNEELIGYLDSALKYVQRRGVKVGEADGCEVDLRASAMSS
jgi:RPA family protein